jgi:hypothetical protein
MKFVGSRELTKKERIFMKESNKKCFIPFTWVSVPKKKWTKKENEKTSAPFQREKNSSLCMWMIFMKVVCALLKWNKKERNNLLWMKNEIVSIKLSFFLRIDVKFEWDHNLSNDRIWEV